MKIEIIERESGEKKYIDGLRLIPEDEKDSRILEEFHRLGIATCVTLIPPALILNPGPK